MGHVIRTEEQQAAVDGLRRFLDDKIDRIYSKEYRDKFVPRDKMGEIMRQLTDFGLVSGVVSEANGGMGIDWLTMIMLFEEVATTSVGPVGAGADQFLRRTHAGKTCAGASA